MNPDNADDAKALILSIDTCISAVYRHACDSYGIDLPEVVEPVNIALIAGIGIHSTAFTKMMGRDARKYRITYSNGICVTQLDITEANYHLALYEGTIPGSFSPGQSVQGVKLVAMNQRKKMNEMLLGYETTNLGDHPGIQALRSHYLASRDLREQDLEKITFAAEVVFANVRDEKYENIRIITNPIELAKI